MFSKKHRRHGQSGLPLGFKDDRAACSKRRVQPQGNADFGIVVLHCAELISQRFAAVIMRIRDPKTTALIFASGKMVVTGAKSEDDSRLASRKYARIIQKLGFNAKFTDFKIQNIVVCLTQHLVRAHWLT